MNTETGTADVEIIDKMYINEWISEFWDNTMKNSVERKYINLFFNKDFSLQLKRVCASFILWTGVMINIFKSTYKRGSSAPSKSNFADIKNK